LVLDNQFFHLVCISTTDAHKINTIGKAVGFNHLLGLAAVVGVSENNFAYYIHEGNAVIFGLAIENGNCEIARGRVGEEFNLNRLFFF